MKIVLVTGSLAPYNARLYDAFGKTTNNALHILQCAKIEPGRKWSVPESKNFSLTSLSGIRLHRSDISHVYFNPGVLAALARLRPDAIIIDGLSPTMIAAAMYGMATNTPYGLAFDGAREFDPGETSWPHARVRQFLGPRASFGLARGEGAREMIEHWGLPKGRAAFVPHTGTWVPPARQTSFSERPFDLLVCGTLNERKNPMFVADVVDRLVQGGFRPRVRVVGEGGLRAPFAARLASSGIEAQFDGYLQQDGIIEAYQSAKLLLFPTLADTWGLVSNEALMCGTPVLASPHSVSARELVQVYGTGLVRELDAGLWAKSVRDMLNSPEAWKAFMARRTEALAVHDLDNAVAGMIKGIQIARTRQSNPNGDKRAIEPAKTP